MKPETVGDDQKILLVSDNHGSMDGLRKAVEREWPFDMMIHLGDSQGTEDDITGMVPCPVYLIRGNCDRNPYYPNVLTLRVGTHKLYLTHGHLQYISGGFALLADQARRDGCDIAIFGHTHTPLIDEKTIPGLYLINPGSIHLPRQKGHKRSYAVMELNEEGLNVTIRYL